MKLFNINLNVSSMKNILKLLLLAFIIILCIYVLYLSSIPTIEAFGIKKDCSNCQIKPSSGNCVPFYDFSYTFNGSLRSLISDDDNFTTISFEKIDTSYIFCPYEPKCSGSESVMDNMLSRDEREELSNEEIDDGLGNYDIRCCSGNPLDESVMNFTDVYEDINSVNINKYTNIGFGDNSIVKKCNNFRNNFFEEIGLNSVSFDDKYKLNYNLTKLEEPKLNAVLINNGYNKIIKFCSKRDKNHPNYPEYMENKDFSGMLFLRDLSDSGHILADPRIVPKTNDEFEREQSIQTLLAKQNMLSVPFHTNDEGERGICGEKIKDIREANERLRKLNPKNPTFNQQFKDIQQELSTIYVDEDGNYMEYNIFGYTPYTSQNQGDTLTQFTTNNKDNYILNEDEFLNCFGDVSNTQDLRFTSQQQKDILDDLTVENINDNFFGVDDPVVKTQQDAAGNKYADTMDLSAEFRHLESVNVGGTAPTGVIDQYLRAINSFYEKQMAAMLGPRTHAVNDQLVFENDGLDTKKSTFFVYETEPNNEYECQPSITGNDKFKNCGPPAYYTDFKP